MVFVLRVSGGGGGSETQWRHATGASFPRLVCAAEDLEETCVAVAARVCGRHLGCAEGHPQAPIIVVVT